MGGNHESLQVRAETKIEKDMFLLRHWCFQKFCDNEAFEEIKKRAIIVHVDMPGHEPGAEDLPDSFNFPCIQVRFETGFVPGRLV